MSPLREMTARLLLGVFVVASVVLFVEIPELYRAGLWWWLGGVGAWGAVWCVVAGVVGWLESDSGRLDRTPESR